MTKRINLVYHWPPVWRPLASLAAGCKKAAGPARPGGAMAGGFPPAAVTVEPTGANARSWNGMNFPDVSKRWTWSKCARV